MLLCYLRHTCIYLCFSVYRATPIIKLETIYTGWLLSRAPLGIIGTYKEAK